MSFVYIIFEYDVNVYWAITRVLERLNYAQRLLPEGISPTLGPDGTGVGHIFWYTLDAKRITSQYSNLYSPINLQYSHGFTPSSDEI